MAAQHCHPETRALFSSHVSIFTVWVSILLVEKWLRHLPVSNHVPSRKNVKGQKLSLVKALSLHQGLPTSYWPELYHMATVAAK